ncbi:putative toxin-antitoxin system toxin component, PIN family [Dyella tabacisoli]|uniref:Putative toxin-antitoxin system toxin component, PIN family n=2 Tax=Dyella tabacisoli TaxID=2282381 RepID=A0A369UQC3_9GAMM|nr:putative toxin-antitoxin system toxin component, PIN family [Dyella tabacisoli]
MPATFKPDTSTPRLVLDTNVCLDLFVFGDAACAPLLAALQGGVVEAVTDEACRAEWWRVLHYPKLALDEAARAQARAAFDAHTSYLSTDELRQPIDAGLPRCADPDDQKFLELALATQARWLISKDKEVLKLGPRTLRAGWFAIVTPQGWQTPSREAW